MDTIYSSFNCIALLCSILANDSKHQSRDWGTMVAVVLWRSLWFIMFLRLTSKGVMYFVCVLYVWILPHGPLLAWAIDPSISWGLGEFWSSYQPHLLRKANIETFLLYYVSCSLNRLAYTPLLWCLLTTVAASNHYLLCHPLTEATANCHGWLLYASAWVGSTKAAMVQRQPPWSKRVSDAHVVSVLCVRK